MQGILLWYYMKSGLEKQEIKSRKSVKYLWQWTDWELIIALTRDAHVDDGNEKEHFIFFSWFHHFSTWTSSKYSWNLKSTFVLPESNFASLNKWNEFHKLDINSLTSVKVWKAAVLLFPAKWDVYNKTPITSGILN